MLGSNSPILKLPPLNETGGLDGGEQAVLYIGSDLLRVLGHQIVIRFVEAGGIVADGGIGGVNERVIHRNRDGAVM
ncbi:MAG TPA: hypothetical protein VIZ18_14085, partial [Ktedonobacteraceae bacterium]